MKEVDMYKIVPFSSLMGKTIVEILGKKDDEELIFKTSDGCEYKQYHCRDCCESVSIEDICGDFSDLIGSPVLKAEESMSEENPKGIEVPEYQDSFTWTFYHLATIKGYVTIRWYGESNGYYSESVDFSQTKATKESVEKELVDRATTLVSKLNYEFQSGLHTMSICKCRERGSRGTQCYLCLIKEFLRESN